jgi:hypothetical protein
MSKAAESVDRHYVTSSRTGIAKRIEGGEPGTQQRSSLGRAQVVGHTDQTARFGEHDFRISAVGGHPGNDRVLAVHDVALPARRAGAIFAGKKANTDPLAYVPALDAFAQCLDAADHFVTGHARAGAFGCLALDRGAIGMAHAAGFDTDSDLATSRLLNRPLNELQLAGRFDDYSSIR